MMTESAYYIFKSPTSLDKRQGFSGRRLDRFQGRVNYTPKPRPKINLTAFRRTPVSDSDCFDGSSAVISRSGTRERSEIKSLDDPCTDGPVYTINRMAGIRATFKAVTHWRRINVDRVSIKVMWRAVYATKLTFYGLARAIVRVPLSIVIHRFESCHDSNTDSYSRCFSQLNRKTDCFVGQILLRSGKLMSQLAGWINGIRPYLTSQEASLSFKAVCGTQTRQVSA